MTRKFITLTVGFVLCASSALAQLVCVPYNATKDTKIKEVELKMQSITKGEHACVDLDLPSGTLWATCNIGATSPEQIGTYFAWGETVPKYAYSWRTYRYCNDSARRQTKYCHTSEYGEVDDIAELSAEDDAATQNWGEEWQMPSYEQLCELIDPTYTTINRVTVKGICGHVIISRKNGNSIFFPACGYRYGSLLFDEGGYGHYWLRTHFADNSDSAYEFYFYPKSAEWSFNPRCFGQNVRPVYHSDKGKGGK